MADMRRVLLASLICPDFTKNTCLVRTYIPTVICAPKFLLMDKMNTV
jgi:hypothetical protein